MRRGGIRAGAYSMVLGFILAACNTAGGQRSPRSTPSPVKTASDAGDPSDAGATIPADAAAAGASWLIQSGDSVFFIGNSFFGDTNDRLYDQVASFGQSLEPPFVIHAAGLIVPGVDPLSWFYQQAESQAAIESGKYTMFVIEGAEREPVDDPEGFKQAVRDYHQAIVANGARMMLFMTWDWAWEENTDFFEKLSRTYDEIGQELGVPVIPAGLIYKDSNEKPYRDEQPYWLTSQGLHQNALGEVVNTYATFGMLTGIDPKGRRIPLIDELAVVSDDLYGYLSRITWARVAPRLER